MKAYERIRKFRKNLLLTQSQFSVKVGVSENTVCRWESDLPHVNRKPSSESIKKLIELAALHNMKFDRSWFCDD